MVVKDIREIFINLLKEKKFVVDKSKVKLLEIINASFEADEPSIFGSVNESYVERELNWYLSKSLNVNDIEDCPKIWKEVCSKNGLINSNYGYLIFSEDNFNQYNNALKALKSNYNTRNAIMIYTRPRIHYDYNIDGMHDFICTNTVSYFIRDGYLHCVVNMRSNDAVFGYKNDRYWQEYVLKKMLKDLNDDTIKLGKIFWNASSLHVYERHFNIVKL